MRGRLDLASLCSVGDLGSGARGKGIKLLPLGGGSGQGRKHLMARKGKRYSKGWGGWAHPGGLWEEWG